MKVLLSAAIMISIATPQYSVAAIDIRELPTWVNTPKRVAAAVGFLSFIYLAGFKDEPDANPMGLTEGLKGFVTKNPLSKNYLQHALKFIDDVIVGYAGKRRGFRVLTSKITPDGQPSVDAKMQKVMKDGEHVELFTANNAGPYGLMGTLWYYIKPVSDGLGELRKAEKAFKWTGNALTRHVD